MILDASAVIAIFFQEPEYQVLLAKLAAAEQVGIGAPTLVECTSAQRCSQAVNRL